MAGTRKTSRVLFQKPGEGNSFIHKKADRNTSVRKDKFVVLDPFLFLRSINDGNLVSIDIRFV